MRLKEILTEGMTFGVGRLRDWGDGQQAYFDPFQKEVTKPCWVCDGAGFEKFGNYTDADGKYHPETKDECRMCNGKKETKEYETTADELNVSNSGGFEIQKMLGLDPDYSGVIKKEDFPKFRRHLIGIKNRDLSPYTQEPTKDVGKMRAHTDDTGQTSIGRGATMYDAGRSHSQVERYIDKLLSLMDFAQKNDCDLTWA